MDFRLILTVLLLSLAVNRLERNLSHADVAWVQPTDRYLEKTHAEVFRLLTFGHWPAGVDWLWMKSLQDSSLTKVPKGTHPELYYYIDLATDLDPRYLIAYHAGSILLTVARGDAVGARNILHKAEKFRQEELPHEPNIMRDKIWEKGWLIPMTLAYLYVFEFDDMKSAAPHFVQAGRAPDSPQFLKNLEYKLSQEGGVYTLARTLIDFMIRQQEENPALQEELLKKRNNLYVSQFIFELNSGFQKFLVQNEGKGGKTPPRIKILWERYRKSNRLPERDPFGGRVFVEESGRVATTTPYEAVLGIRD